MSFLPEDPAESSPSSSEFVRAMSGVFESLGRAIVCVDASFRIVHASDGLDAIAGEGTARAISGRTLEETFGSALFGQDSPMRDALARGERREGWSATLRADGRESRPLSLTAAPLCGVQSPLCDPRVAFLLVVRTGEDLGAAGGGAPTLFAGMVARSSRMRALFDLVQNLAESDATVLITGESGTGKEMVARALHDHSPRHAAPFVAVNCGAIPSELLESELFGHVRGAFTGAVRDREGRFEAAAGGALFLDEVGDLPLALQVKLLRVLQERTYERVGESRTRQTSARILAATNRDLRREVAAGRFREDLFYRLRVVPIEIPPLRARREDIEPLARQLLSRVCARQGRSLMLAPDAMRVLLEYAWPGNARELENALEYAVAVCRGQTLHESDLPSEVRAMPDAEPVVRESAHAAQMSPAVRPAAPAGDDRERIRAALESNRWNRDRAAAALGMSRTTLWRRMRELGMAG
ncbi:MAG: sigma 54-interacting transcriptional regulator [Candidatus Eisenbacteria bacterium]|uniref:Sigma 54-interacting transcriptional regulator n=1 Tax=Eiseniibacteriota bacterium TaxID=2212470 RepID=A0A933W0X7_UNCEI|nr:sigma 54-interacting transcriptional regulator [Candidatus Eisenbacteria bacterium]